VDHDDFAADEQLAHSELAAVMRQLRNGKLDIARAIRTPSQDRGRDVVHVTFRYATYLDAAVGELCGKGKKFANRSEFFRHYAVVGLAMESLLADEPVYDAHLVQVQQQDDDLQLQMMDDTIAACAKALKEADGDPHRQKILSRLTALRDICERQGYLERLGVIDGAINKRR
jgi:hypothetical protein